MVNAPQTIFSYCENNGIIHEITAFYAPQQNIVVEKKNTTLVDMINSMLCSSALSNNLREALLSSRHILNMVPYKNYEKTPYKL